MAGVAEPALARNRGRIGEREERGDRRDGADGALWKAVEAQPEHPFRQDSAEQDRDLRRGCGSPISGLRNRRASRRMDASVGGSLIPIETLEPSGCWEFSALKRDRNGYFFLFDIILELNAGNCLGCPEQAAPGALVIHQVIRKICESMVPLSSKAF